MKWLNPLGKEVTIYSSDKSISDLKALVQTLITDSKSLTGKFCSQAEFNLYPRYLTPRHSLFSDRESSSALLEGKVFLQNETQVQITVRPGKSLIIFFWLLIFACCFSLITDTDLGLFSALAPILFLAYIHFLKAWLRNKVISSLALSK